MKLTVRTVRGRFTLVAALLVILIAGGGVSSYLATKIQNVSSSDATVRFSMEAYDLIEKNYWVKPGGYAQFNTPELPELFRLALNKAGVPSTLASSTRSGAEAMLAEAFVAATSSEAKKKLALDTLTIVLYNLPPVGRASLLSAQQVKELRQNVANINPANDLYKDLGVPTSAPPEAIEKAYDQKVAVLEQSTSTAAKEELEKVTYAKEVLSDSGKKQLYDTAKVEPSVSARTLGKTLYLGFNKISPTTLQEFAWEIARASTTPALDSLILDFRGNVGGALDFTPAFLGLFIGQNQYVFDLYRQGDTEAQRTTLPQFPELSRYREVAVLTDSMTQSTAELTAAALKRLRIAHIVGGRTRGWGSVENTYPLSTSIDPDTTYALFLVNSLTLRDDQQPIEQNGVLPDVDTAAAGWRNQLTKYFTSASLITALSSTAALPPR